MLDPVNDNQRLPHFPVSVFSTVMGTTGFAIAWQRACSAWGMPEVVALVLVGGASLLFLVLLISYLLKACFYRHEVVAEWKHPVRVSFFPTISISFLLLAIAWRQTAPDVALTLWIAGAVAHFVFTLAILSSWMYHTHYDIKHANPGWFIPVVGNLFVPISASGFQMPEVGWFFFSIGMVFWLVLLTIVVYRIIFHDPLPPRLVPTLFILIAPPAVGMIAYVSLTGSVDAFARVLYYTALFLTLFLGSNVARFLRNEFYISSWAYSFPIAAITIASFVMKKHTDLAGFDAIAAVLILVLSLVVLVLLGKTFGAMARGEICRPEQ